MDKKAITGFGLAALVILMDQLSKAWVLYGLKFSQPGDHVAISKVFNLTFVWNQGVSFGLFQADSMVGRIALSLFAFAVVVLLTIWLARVQSGVLAMALGFIIGGALGNLIDRIRFGKVVDFLDFSGLHFPWVFNVADAAINVGVFLILLDAFILEPRRKKAELP